LKGAKVVEHTEVRSENARNVILSYQDVVYYINQVNVQIEEGTEKVKATFHGKKIGDNRPRDLEVEISQAAYNVLLDYAKLDKRDMMLVLEIANGEAKWCLMDENWLKNQIGLGPKPSYII
jgi:hypothetical protein